MTAAPLRPAPAPAVSVCVSTYRRPQLLSRLLHALERQDFPDFEVVVCENGSEEETQQLVRRAVGRSPLPTTLVEHARNRGPAAGRETSWRAARGTVIAFTDDDCVPEPGWLRAGLAALEAGADVVVGQTIADPAQAWRIGPFTRAVDVRDAQYFQTCNVFYRRADLERVGGFDPAFTTVGGEDTDLGLRVLGGRPGTFEPRALVHHDVRAGRAVELARETLNRWGDLPLVVRKHPEVRRDRCYRRWFWKRTHPPTVLALTGLALAPWHRSALVLLAPWLRERGWVNPVSRSRWRRVTAMPGTLLVDTAEVVTVARGSVRHRCLLL